MSDLNGLPAHLLCKVPYVSGAPRHTHKPREKRDGPIQQDIIPRLVEMIPGCQVKGWKAETLKAFLSSEDVLGFEEDFQAALDGLNVIPDAFVIYPETRELHFFEVEIRHLLTNDKLQAYAKFVTDMDYYGIRFELYSVNQHLHVNEVLLFPHYLEWLRSAHKP